MDKYDSFYDRLILPLQNYAINHRFGWLQVVLASYFIAMTGVIAIVITVIEPLVTVIVILSLAWVGGYVVLAEWWAGR